MPPTMILIGVCAGAAEMSEAAIAAKTAAARILRMRRFLVTTFSCCSWFLECLAGPRVPCGGGFCGRFGGHEASWCQFESTGHFGGVGSPPGLGARAGVASTAQTLSWRRGEKAFQVLICYFG